MSYGVAATFAGRLVAAGVCPQAPPGVQQGLGVLDLVVI